MQLNSNTFYLDNLEDEDLFTILSYTPEEFDIFVETLISNFFPKASNTEIIKLKVAYRSSFALESFYRSNPVLYEGFTCLYTKTGLIKEIVNDIYDIPPEKTTVH